MAVRASAVSPLGAPAKLDEREERLVRLVVFREFLSTRLRLLRLLLDLDKPELLSLLAK